jgi:hypothetical protein
MNTIKIIAKNDLNFLKDLYEQKFRFVAVEKQNNELTYFAYKYKPLCNINILAEFVDVEIGERIGPDDYKTITFNEDITWKYTKEITKTKVNNIDSLQLSFFPYKIKEVLENIEEVV